MTVHTVATLIETVCDQFAAEDLSYGHGTDNAWDEAVFLVLHITGFADDQSSLDAVVSDEQIATCIRVAQERITTRQPLAYLLGHCHYMGLDFEIQPGVVVPRSPIGYLMEEGLEPWLPSRVTQVLDLCSGSGCLGIVAAYLFPSAEVTLVEMDQAASELAQRNIAHHELTDRVRLITADVTGPLTFDRRFDLIVSNPPYVDARDMTTLPAEYRAEPSSGLAAGEDGLSVMAGILSALPQWLALGGLFVGEIGASAPALLKRYQKLPFIWPELKRGGEGVFALEAAALTSHTASGSADTR